MSEHTTSLPATAGSAASANQVELRFLLPESKTNKSALFGGAGVSWSIFFVILALIAYTRPDQAIQAILPDFPL